MVLTIPIDSSGRNRLSTGIGSGGPVDRAQGPLGHRLGAAAQGHRPGLDQLADAERLQHPQQGVELVAAAGDLDRDRVRRHVDDAGAEQRDGLQDVAAGRGIGAHLDQHELALHGGRRLELDDLEHVDQLVQLLGDLLEGQAPRPRRPG